jgi:hypothetical protein
MGGPIVRTGTTPEFWRNWDRIFGNTTEAKTPAAAAEKPAEPAAARPARKTAAAKKKVAARTAAKPAKKTSKAAKTARKKPR